MHNSAEADLVGRTIADKFLIESLIGGGAMGAVYRARQIALDKTVAIKVMRPERARNVLDAALFQREAKTASRLDHQNSVRVIDYGQEADGLLYIAMEYFPGHDLLQVLAADWPLSATRIVNVLSQALAAVAVGHEIGIVHRDLKPENILVQSGTDDEGCPDDLVKVCDFGIAKLIEPGHASVAPGEPRVTDGVIIGTPHYMSPEQARGERLDLRTDLYSMGVILYQLLTDRLPFEGETPVDVVLQHVRDEPVPPSKHLPWVDARLEAICLKALRKKREERYQTAREMRADLRAVLSVPTPTGAALLAIDPEANTLAPPDVAGPPAVVVHTPTGATPRPMAAPAAASRPRASRAGLAGVALVLFAAGFASFVAAHFDHRMAREGPAPGAFLTAPGPVRASPTSAAIATGQPASSASASDPEVRAPTAPSPLGPSAPAQLPAGAPPVPSSSPRDMARQVIGSQAATVRSSIEPGSLRVDRPMLPSAPRSAVSAAPPALAAPVASPAASLMASTTVEPDAPTAPAPISPPIDPSRARLTWSVAASGGASQAEVRRAISHVAGAWTSCYQDGLRAAGRPSGGSGVLHLSTDDEGYVVQAAVTGFALAEVGACISAAARIRIGGVDTGSAWADVKLLFQAEQAP